MISIQLIFHIYIYIYIYIYKSKIINKIRTCKMFIDPKWVVCYKENDFLTTKF